MAKHPSHWQVLQGGVMTLHEIKDQKVKVYFKTEFFMCYWCWCILTSQQCSRCLKYYQTYSFYSITVNRYCMCHCHLKSYKVS